MRLQYVYVAVLAVFALVASVNASSLSKLGKRKKIDPNKLPKVDLKKSPKVDPKVIAKADSNVVTRAESKVLARVDTKVTTNAVPTVPKAVREMPKEGANLIKKLNGFVKEKKSLDDVFSSQVDGKQKLFDADGLPMYVRFSEKTAELSKSWREKMQPRDVAQLLKGGKVVMDRIHQGVYKKYLDAFNKANIAKPTA
ncbi:hypothetical protein GQ600_17122 [Phytophthora cactorum]|nr:hypothetical protein GQ600_17122 [Phytophthora cactorum]